MIFGCREGLGDRHNLGKRGCFLNGNIPFRRPANGRVTPRMVSAAGGYKLEIAACDFDANYVHELSWSVSGGERNSPKILRLIILLDKLDGVRGDSMPCDHLRNHARGDLDTTLILH